MELAQALKHIGQSIIVIGSVYACATPPEGSELSPLDNYNRAVFEFNESVDKAVLAPVAKTYANIVPKPIRISTSNVLSNLNEPVNFANKVLQGDIDGAADVTGRFLMNSTIGVLGLFDVASLDGIQKQKEDFGQTLAVWGVPNSGFIMIPFLGPSTVRDIIARPVDAAFNPINYTEQDPAYYAVTGALGLLNGRIAADPAIKTVREQLDPYTAMKRGYLVFRQSQIDNGQRNEASYENLPSFDDPEFGDTF